MRSSLRRLLLLLGVCALGAGISPASAQDMPDPSLIHGRAIPAPELPNGTVTVRVVREAIGNNLPGQQVRVTVGGTTRTATTDEQGRAEFRDLPQGEARADVTVSGEALVSQPFPVPTSGGLRVILVAGIAQAAERRKQEEATAAAAPPTRGIIVLGGSSRVLLQFNNDTLQVFYVLEIVNSARTRVDIGGPLVVQLPIVAQSPSVLEGSSPSASVNGNRLIVTGPFASGSTLVQVGYIMPYDESTLTITQTWPAALQQVTVAVEKFGDLQVSSPQLESTRDVRAEDGQVFVLGSGPGLPAGGSLTIRLANLPAHSRVPRYVAFGLALAIVGLGVWLSLSGRAAHEDERQTLVKRRDTLLAQLEKLELKHRAGGGDAVAYAARRERIVGELEQIYGDLDEISAGPRGGGEGVAA